MNIQLTVFIFEIANMTKNKIISTSCSTIHIPFVMFAQVIGIWYCIYSFIKTFKL